MRPTSVAGLVFADPAIPAHAGTPPRNRPVSGSSLGLNNRKMAYSISVPATPILLRRGARIQRADAPIMSARPYLSLPLPRS